jgi:hypothetical protein
MLLTTPVARGGATAPAQSGPRLEITVYGITARWWGSAVGTVVRAELRGPGGLKAGAETRGYPSVFYFAAEDSGIDARILPGDQITILPDDGPPVTVDVPRLSADVDATRDVVAGVAAPGASIDVRRDLDEPLGRVIAGVDGSFRLDLAGQHDLVPGDVGVVQLAAPDDVVFISWWEVPSVELWPDARRMVMRTSLGSTMTLEIQPLGGARRTIVPAPTQSSMHHGNWYDDGPRLVPGTRVTVSHRSAIPGMGHA